MCVTDEQAHAAMEAYYAAFRFGKQDGVYYSEEERLEAMRSAIEAALALSHAAHADYVVVPREALRVEARRLRYRATETCGLGPKTTDAGAQMVHTAEALEQFASQYQEGGK